VRADDRSNKQLTRAVQAEASILARRHRKAWHKVKKSDLRTWLGNSAATLVDRWRARCTRPPAGSERCEQGSRWPKCDPLFTSRIATGAAGDRAVGVGMAAATPGTCGLQRSR
jgi:hypothetical protein